MSSASCAAVGTLPRIQAAPLHGGPSRPLEAAQGSFRISSDLQSQVFAIVALASRGLNLHSKTIFRLFRIETTVPLTECRSYPSHSIPSASAKQ